MKKLALTIAIVLGITLGASAQNRGLFDRGPEAGSDTYYYNRDPLVNEEPVFGLPSSHGSTNDQATPIGGGTLLLIGFGAAYAIRKKNRK